MTDVCMIIGAGAGIGGHVGKRFAQDGYHVALCRRSDQDGLDRMLCQTLNAEFAPKNIHVAHIVIDSSVNAPDTLGKLLGPERFAKLREAKANGKDELMEPAAIADTYFHIAHQHRSAWTFELDMRAFTDTAWWNHPLDI